jgi:hypothetical protein
VPFLTALVAAHAVVLAQPDPYGPRPSETALALAYDAERGGPRQDRAIERWLHKHPGAPRPERAMLAHRLCLAYGVLVGGERRLAACRLSVSFSGDVEERGDLAIAEALRREPRIGASGSATVPLSRSPVGILSVTVEAGGAASSWIVDSGAEITTIPESTAKKLGARMLDGATNVGTSTAVRVDGALGVIDTLTIGSARVRHLPVLVLPDAMLRIKDGELIAGILGLPVLAAFRRVAWLHRGATLCLGSGVCDAPLRGVTSQAVYWHENGLGVPLTLAGGTRGAHLDTGANAFELSSAGAGLLAPGEIASATEQEMQVGGVGGMGRVKLTIVPAVGYSLAGTALRANRVPVSPALDGVGRVGSDAIGQLDLLAVDFDRMRISAVAASE